MSEPPPRPTRKKHFSNPRPRGSPVSVGARVSQGSVGRGPGGGRSRSWGDGGVERSERGGRGQFEKVREGRDSGSRRHAMSAGGEKEKREETEGGGRGAGEREEVGGDGKGEKEGRDGLTERQKIRLALSHAASTIHGFPFMTKKNFKRANR